MLTNYKQDRGGMYPSIHCLPLYPVSGPIWGWSLSHQRQIANLFQGHTYTTTNTLNPEGNFPNLIS